MTDNNREEYKPFRIVSELGNTSWQHWAMMWGPCGHGTKVVENGERLPDPPCPYCKIEELTRIADAALDYVNIHPIKSLSNDSSGRVALIMALGDNGYSERLERKYKQTGG